MDRTANLLSRSANKVSRREARLAKKAFQAPQTVGTSDVRRRRKRSGSAKSMTSDAHHLDRLARFFAKKRRAQSNRERAATAAGVPGGVTRTQLSNHHERAAATRTRTRLCASGGHGRRSRALACRGAGAAPARCGTAGTGLPVAQPCPGDPQAHAGTRKCRSTFDGAPGAAPRVRYVPGARSAGRLAAVMTNAWAMGVAYANRWLWLWLCQPNSTRCQCHSAPLRGGLSFPDPVSVEASVAWLQDCSALSATCTFTCVHRRGDN
eukprot:5563217-Prymnesium_polylepis.1